MVKKILSFVAIFFMMVLFQNCGGLDGQYPAIEVNESSSANDNPNGENSGSDASNTDLSAPIITNGFPASESLVSGTVEKIISVVTNEVSSCRYSLVPGVAFTSMTELLEASDGLSHSLLIQGLEDGTDYQFYIKCRDNADNSNTVDFAEVSFSIEDPAVGTGRTVSDNFSGTGSLVGYTTTNPEVLPKVGRINGRYHAELTDNTANKNLHFNEEQGRLDAKLVTFPFEYIARNIGIGTLANSQVAPAPDGSTFMFAGIQVHTTTLSDADSAHVVVGHRGGTGFTIEGKNTVDGDSRPNDNGLNTVPSGRADLRIVGNSDRSLTVYWQTPNPGSSANDSWELYRGTGNLPGPTAAFGPSVYIGLITYAYRERSVPFVGTCDSVELVGE